MRKIICCILSVFVSFLMVSPVYAENGNSVADHEPTEIVYINELEDTDRGIGSVAYVFTVFLVYIDPNGQKIVDSIMFYSDVFDCFAQIYSYVQQYVGDRGRTYVSHEAQHTGTEVDDGCWSPAFPNNPFCRIARN